MCNIESFIKNGITGAYYENLILKVPNNDLQDRVTEYLFTVNVAQQLIKWQGTPDGSNRIIFLEYDATEFKTNAFPQLRWVIVSEDPLTGRKLMRRGEHGSIRDGRVDISIMRRKNPGEAGSSPRSCAGVEIKAVNPNIDLVIDDVVRLTDALCATDEIDSNSIEQCFVTFCKRLDTPAEIFSGQDFDVRANRYVAEIGPAINQAISRFNTDCKISWWEVLKVTADEYASMFPEGDVDAADVAANSGAVIGVMVKLVRK